MSDDDPLAADPEYRAMMRQLDPLLRALRAKIVQYTGTSLPSAATMGAAAVAGDGGGASIGPITLAVQFSGAPPENAEELAEQVVPIIRREIKAMMEVA